MNKLIFFIVFGILIISNVIALENKIIQTEITVDYSPSGCTNSCNVVGNITNCTNVCAGTLTISGENLLKTYTLGTTGFTQTLENNVVRDIGNETDITNMFNRLGDCLNLMNKTDELDKCKRANTNVSVALLMCKQDVGYKSNFTKCQDLKRIAESKLQRLQTDTTEKENKIKDLKNLRIWIALIGALAGYFLATKLIPYLKNREEYKDQTKQENPTIGY